MSRLAIRILFLLIAMALPIQTIDATTRDEAYCATPDSGQPMRFCLADRRYERLKANLAALLPKARRAAQEQRRAILEFSRRNGGVTLDGNPVTVLDRAQRAWEVSYVADCSVFALSRATGGAGTEGVTAQQECNADRIAERIGFLKTIYVLGD